MFSSRSFPPAPTLSLKSAVANIFQFFFFLFRTREIVYAPWRRTQRKYRSRSPDRREDGIRRYAHLIRALNGGRPGGTLFVALFNSKPIIIIIFARLKNAVPSSRDNVISRGFFATRSSSRQTFFEGDSSDVFRARKPLVANRPFVARAFWPRVFVRNVLILPVHTIIVG